jgi:hypothetical protein
MAGFTLDTTKPSTKAPYASAGCTVAFWSHAERHALWQRPLETKFEHAREAASYVEPRLFTTASPEAVRRHANFVRTSRVFCSNVRRHGHTACRSVIELDPPGVRALGGAAYTMTAWL